MRTILLTLLLCSSALGQDIVVTDTAVKVGTALTCPRFSTLYPAANNLIVPAETTQTLPTSFNFDVIEVSGTLKLSRTADTNGKFIVIQVLPGGSLDFGSETDPVLRKVDLQVKDSPLLTGTDGNLGPDPEQFGSGILIFGEWKSYGRQLNKTWTTMQPVAAGATTLTLTDSVNWQVGDELLIPDTRQVRKRDFSVSFDPNYTPIRRESPVTITAINGSTITLSKPLDFEHDAAFGQLPYVANCTRNIVIRSENPNGVRGHTMFMGTAHVNLYYTSFIGLGRTRAEALNSFNSNSQHVGTNQIARYGGPHWHHVHGHADAQGLTGRLVGCYGYGGDATKWFHVQHGTHDLFVADNVAQRFVGACFTTEDGNEVRGQYLRNFAAHSIGNGLNGKFNINNNSPGSEGAGFWFHGSMHTAEDNVAIANATGVSVVHRSQVSRPYPSVPGGENDTPFDPSMSVPLSFKRFTLLSNIDGGLELWNTPIDWTIADSQIIHSGLKGIFMGNGEQCRMTVRGCRILASSPFGEAIHSSAGYTPELIVEDTEIAGHYQGLSDVINHMRLKNVKLKNYLNINWSNFTGVGMQSELIDVMHEKLLPNTIFWTLGNGQGPNVPLAEARHKVTNWQGTGKNYDVYENRDAPAGAVTLDGLVNAKAALTGDVTTVNHPPVVSAITPSPADVDPATPGVQEYVGPVTYSFMASDPDNDPLTIKIFYSINGGSRTEYTGPRTANGWTFTYTQPVNYAWTVQADDGKGGVTESSLVVQVIAQPTPPPPTDVVTRAEFDALKGWLQRVVDHLRSTPQQ